MTALKAINGHAVHVFRKHVMDLAKKQGLNSVISLTRKIYGKDAISNVYPILTGKLALTERKAKIWAPCLSVSAEDLLQANRPIAAMLPNRKPGPKVPSKRPPNTQVFRDYVLKLLKIHDLTQQKFAIALGIRNPSLMHRILSGRSRLSEKMAARWSTVLGVSARDLLAMNQKEVVTTQRAARVSPEKSKPRQVAVRTPPPDNNEARIDRFSFVINPDGTAMIRLSLDDLPLSVALKLVGVLDLENLLSPTSQRALTYDDPEKKGPT